MTNPPDQGRGGGRHNAAQPRPAEVDRNERDERQATEYVAGITRWRRWLDFLIDQFYRGEGSRMDPALRQIRRALPRIGRRAHAGQHHHGVVGHAGQSQHGFSPAAS